MFFDIFISQQHGMSLLFMNLFVSLLPFFYFPNSENFWCMWEKYFQWQKIDFFIFMCLIIFKINFLFSDTFNIPMKFNMNSLLSQKLHKRIWMSWKSIRSRTFVRTLCKMIRNCFLEATTTTGGQDIFNHKRTIRKGC